MLKKLLLSFVLIIGALLSIAFVRTLMHAAPEPTVNVGLAADIDGEAATNNLAASIRFKTISHQDKEKFSPQEFEGFIKWAADTYPEFHSAMQLEMLEYTLLFKWEGSDNSLAPILLTAHYDVVPVIPGTESIWEEEPFAGVISNNRIWGRGTLDDKSGRLELSVWAEQFDMYRNILNKDALLVVKGAVSEDSYTGGLKMVAESIQSIYEARCSKLEKLSISVAKADIGNGWVNDFHNSLNDYKYGSCPVVIDYAHPTAEGQFSLGKQWRVQPKDELITRLKEQFGSTNVNLDYG